uniref:MerR family DNA-binding transcriptional regulator n=1 Tax=Acidithiobacillus ferrianus TaxID=2678518 RepID=A0A845UHQ9_9PROT|nr:MerR family DNA-binding transcriptional regulator [Acidithiobacillus ferrianus]
MRSCSKQLDFEHTLQQAAKACGLTVHTLRYYERIGLIGPVPR